MSVLKGEGTTVILYGSTSVPTGARNYPGYLARPDLMGEWPTVVVVPPSYVAASSVNAICRLIARHGIAAVAPGAGGLDAYVNFITNPAGHWSNAEHGYGVLALGDGSAAAIRQAAVPGLVTAAALVDPELDDAAITALDGVGVPLLGCSGRDSSDGVDDARNAAPHAEWVVYDGTGNQFWNINSDEYVASAAEDSAERVIEFFSRWLPRAI